MKKFLVLTAALVVSSVAYAQDRRVIVSENVDGWLITTKKDSLKHLRPAHEYMGVFEFEKKSKGEIDRISFTYSVQDEACLAGRGQLTAHVGSAVSKHDFVLGSNNTASVVAKYMCDERIQSWFR